MNRIAQFIDGLVTVFLFVFVTAFAVILPTMAAWKAAAWLLSVG